MHPGVPCFLRVEFCNLHTVLDIGNRDKCLPVLLPRGRNGYGGRKLLLRDDHIAGLCIVDFRKMRGSGSLRGNLSCLRVCRDI